MAKFLFDQSFDPRPGNVSTPAKPTFGEADIAAALERGRAEGLAAGLAQARAEATQAAAAALGQIQQQLAHYAEVHSATLRDMRNETGLLAFRIAGKLAPALMERHPLTEVEALVGRCLADLRDEPRIVVRVSQTLAAALEARLDGLAAASGFPGHVVLLADERISGADCRVEWADGGAERDTPALAARIEAAVTRFIDQKAGNRPIGDIDG